MSSEGRIEERLLALLKLLAYEQRSCRNCRQMLYFVQLPEGAITPGTFRVKDCWVVAYNGEGENHVRNCLGATRKRDPEQQSLLGIPTGAGSNGFGSSLAGRKEASDE